MESLQEKLHQRRSVRTGEHGARRRSLKSAGARTARRRSVEDRSLQREALFLHTDHEVDKLRLEHAEETSRRRQRRKSNLRVEARNANLRRVRLLREVDVFRAAGLKLETLKKVAAAMDAQHFARGATVFAEGDPGDRLYVITKGRVDFFQGGQQINSLGFNDYFGEVSLLETARSRSRRTATAVAATDDVSVLSLHRDYFRELFPDAANAVSLTLGRFFFGGIEDEDGREQLEYDELAPAQQARRAMQRRSVAFLEGDRLRRGSGSDKLFSAQQIALSRHRTQASMNAGLF